ncbi:MAG: hypothetical protein Q8O28_14710 [Smithellaceae bacterium]|nr:hypothetical protein [Smithellaceae bacterium]
MVRISPRYPAATYYLVLQALLVLLALLVLQVLQVLQALQILQALPSLVLALIDYSQST